MRTSMSGPVLLLLALPIGLLAVSPDRDWTYSGHPSSTPESQQNYGGQPQTDNDFGRVDLSLGGIYGHLAQDAFGQTHHVPPVSSSSYFPVGDFSAPQSSYGDYSLPPLPSHSSSGQSFATHWTGYYAPSQQDEHQQPSFSHAAFGYDPSQPIHYSGVGPADPSHYSADPSFSSPPYLQDHYSQRAGGLSMPSAFNAATTFSYGGGGSGSSSQYPQLALENPFGMMQQGQARVEPSGSSSVPAQRAQGIEDVMRVEALVAAEWKARGLSEEGKGAREVAAHVAEIKVNHPERSLDISKIAGQIVRNERNVFYGRDYTEWSTKYTDKIRNAKKKIQTEHPEWDAAQIKQELLSGLHDFSATRITPEYKKSEEKLMLDVWNDFYPNHLEPLLTSEEGIPLSAIAQAAKGYSWRHLTKKRALVVVRKYLYHQLGYT